MLSILSVSTFSQTGDDNDKKWSKIGIDHNYIPVSSDYKWDQKNYQSRSYNFGTDQITVDPNFRPWPGSNSTQSEMSVDVHPLDVNTIFCSANATNWPFSTIWGTGVYWSLDGATTWTGFNNPPFGTNSGDPASVIGSNGYFYEGYITNAGGMGVATSTDNGTTWSSHVADNSSGLDKNHLMVDKVVGSPFEHRLYDVWTSFSGANIDEIEFNYSTNFGTNWATTMNISSGVNALGHNQGVNVQTGPNGEVYACWAIYDANWTDGEDGIGFNVSTNGGATWGTAIRVYSVVNFGIRGYLKPTQIRVSSFPSMAVDRSGGPNNGNIYITWPQRGVTPAGSDPDIVMVKSTNGGTTWSSPVRVNDDPINNGKDQYYPWMTVDQSTGQLVFVFYDSRETTNDSSGVWGARSLDGGSTFENFRISDENFKPKPIGGLAGGYQGDYIGIAALDDIAYPYWMDDRTGNYQGWMSVVSFGPPCPIDPPSNPTPANGTVDVSINLAQLSWDNGAGASQMELWFGEAGSMTLVHDGALITSWSVPGPLVYNTAYNWRVKGRNDTCTVAGPVWAFTTEQDPNLVIDTVKVYPQSLAYWTGTTDGSSKTDNSEVRGLNSEDGWLMFDISSIPDEATINQVTFYGYVNSTYWPYWSATPLPGLNPLTATASELKSVTEANSGNGTAYTYQNESSSYTPGWHNYLLESWTNTDFQAALVQDWFAMGMDSRDNSTSYWINWDGWNQTNLPYLEVIFEYVVPVELTSFAASVNEGNVTLKWTTATETNNQGFELQRQSGSNEFQKVSYVPGYGTTTEAKSYSYVDEKMNSGNYSYRLKQVNYDGSYEYSEVVAVEVTTPIEYALAQNYPNPFNPGTIISYSIPQNGLVTLEVYNLLGEKVASLINEVKEAGRYEVKFDASKLASGIYVYSLKSGSFNSVKKMLLMK
jgi:hypothetical protein